MTQHRAKFNLKIFQINKLYFELKGREDDDIVDIIKSNHEKYIHSKKTDWTIVNPKFEKSAEGDFKYYSYCYNQPKDQDYWKLFLPESITTTLSFDIIEFSFVLFIAFNNEIYCIIGGSGINVIKKYINGFFGIELYQHFANPKDDIMISVNTRGVTGNLSQRASTYNAVQTVREAMVYSEIPKKLKIKIRDDLRTGLFAKYNLDEENALMEISSYFSIRKKINFEELKLLITDIDKIMSDKSNYVKLSLFNRVTESNLVDRLDKELLNELVNDVLLVGTDQQFRASDFNIVEIVNYNKIEKFYECNKYKLHIKNQHWSKDVVVRRMGELYLQAIVFIFKNVEVANQFEVTKKLYSLSITGIIDEKEVTFGTFLSHVVRELTLDSKKYFRIDDQWFELEDRFLEQLKQEAVENYTSYELKPEILNHWSNGSEGDYNNSHISSKHFVFDRRIKENIELCDILYLDDSDIYFIHVKDGFDTHMRSLYSQITLASQRLWNDINNVSGSSYLIDTVTYYNKHNPTKKLDGKILLNKISTKQLRVHFVMAYRYKAYPTLNAVEKIQRSDSNIARFSVVQTVNEIKNYNIFNFSIKDISQITNKKKN